MADGDLAEPVLVQGSRTSASARPGLLAGGRVLPLEWWARSHGVGRLTSLTELVFDWDNYADELREIMTATDIRAVIAEHGHDERTSRLHAPIQPRHAFCAIGNYRSQVLEAALDADDGPAGPSASSRRAAAARSIDDRAGRGEPYVCLTSTARVSDPDGELALPADITTLDWEVEIAAVIGRTARNISISEAPERIAGYCIANDLTVRSRVVRSDVPRLGSDWLQSKGVPGSLPLGPWFVPVWQVPTTNELRLRLFLNGQQMQDGRGADMIFGVEAQVAYLSRHTRLEPGDLICTGSPAGFGSHYGRYLRPGDVINAEISGLGRQEITCVAEQPWPGAGHDDLPASA
jgi:2,4-didehydro-3-deoxy-L-rhamnonate hydrolase